MSYCQGCADRDREVAKTEAARDAERARRERLERVIGIVRRVFEDRLGLAHVQRTYSWQEIQDALSEIELLSGAPLPPAAAPRRE